jgi:hypothetical protein
MPLTANSRPYRAVIDEATAATHEIVAAVALKRIVVVNLVVTLASGQTLVWKSATTVLSGAIDSSYTAGDTHAGLFETEPGEALNFTLSAASAVDGHLTYVLLP